MPNLKEIEEGLKSGGLHPNETKKELAMSVVSYFHGDEVAREMRQKFEAVFKKGGVPEDAPQIEIDQDKRILDVLVDSGLLTSKGEARRMIKQNAVGLVDGEKITSDEYMVGASLKGQTLKVGKRKFLKIV